MRGGTLVACQSIKAGPGCLASRHATRGANSSPWFDDSLAAVEWFPQQLASERWRLWTRLASDSAAVLSPR